VHAPIGDDCEEQERLYRVLDTNIAGGEARWHALQELIDRLARNHQINDRAGLAQAVRTAMLIYRDRGALDKKDVKALLTSIAKIAEVLSREGNDQRIADIMMDKDRRWMKGAPWDHEKTVATTIRIWQIRADLSQLAHILRRPRKRKADMRLHRMVETLERYWKSLGREITRDFHQDPQTKRRVAVTESMRFIESILTFIDPDAAKKLPSATRHRLERVAKIPT
jgi:hypothetical protein